MVTGGVVLPERGAEPSGTLGRIAQELEDHFRDYPENLATWHLWHFLLRDVERGIPPHVTLDTVRERYAAWFLTPSPGDTSGVAIGSETSEGQ